MRGAVGKLSEANMLDVINRLSYGERIVRMCLTPRTTTELRESFERWTADILIYMGRSFAEHMKQLEVANVIQFVNGKWTLTKEGKNIVEKYLG